MTLPEATEAKTGLIQLVPQICPIASKHDKHIIYIQYIHIVYFVQLQPISCLVQRCSNSKTYKNQCSTAIVEPLTVEKTYVSAQPGGWPCGPISLQPHCSKHTLGGLSSDFFNQPKPPHNNPPHLHYWIQISTTPLDIM